MKKTAIIAFMITLVAMLAFSAAAVTVGDATVGGKKADREKAITATFSINNNETSTITVTSITANADAKYNVKFSAISNISASSSGSVTVTADIPLDFDAVEESASASDFLKAKAFDIGDITVVTSVGTFTSNLFMQAVNQLEIKDASLECSDSAGNSKSEKLDDGDKVENLKPGMDCVLTIEVENDFNDKDKEDANGNDLKIGDIDFDDVEIEIEIDDDDLDVSEDATVDNLNAEDRDEETIDFEIDQDVKDGSYDMEIRIFGTDDNGAFHGEKWSVDLEVDRLTHDVQIRGATLNPQSISACTGGTLRGSAVLLNLGKRDEDEAAFELDIPELNLNAKRTGIQLDEDDSQGIDLSVSVPEDTKAGVFTVNLNSFFDNVAPSNTKSFELTVTECEKEEETSTTTVVTPTDVSVDATGGAVATPTSGVSRARVRSTGSSFTEGSGYLWLLGGLSVLVVVIILALLAVFFRKPKAY